MIPAPELELRATLPLNVGGLAMAPIASTVIAEAQRLRAAGAQVVVVGAHAGGGCARFDTPTDLTSCDGSAEIFDAARAMPPGLVDAIVAGHTHDGLAHVVNDIPIVQSYSRGDAFGRVDLEVAPAGMTSRARATVTRIHPPRRMCPALERVAASACQPGEYEGKPVLPDPAVAGAVAGALEAARALRETRLGVAVTAPVLRAYGE